MKARIPPKVKDSIQDLLSQAKKADVLIDEMKKKLQKFDKEAAKASLHEIGKIGLSEAHKMRDKLQHQLVDITAELAKTSGKLKVESEKVRHRVKDTLNTVTTQIKNITEAERSKRRGRS